MNNAVFFRFWLSRFFFIYNFLLSSNISMIYILKFLLIYIFLHVQITNKYFIDIDK